MGKKVPEWNTVPLGSLLFRGYWVFHPSVFPDSLISRNEASMGLVSQVWNPGATCSPSPASRSISNQSPSPKTPIHFSPLAPLCLPSRHPSLQVFLHCGEFLLTSLNLPTQNHHLRLSKAYLLPCFCPAQKNCLWFISQMRPLRPRAMTGQN